jgi:hypothetical protein
MMIDVTEKLILGKDPELLEKEEWSGKHS